MCESEAGWVMHTLGVSFLVSKNLHYRNHASRITRAKIIKSEQVNQKDQNYLVKNAVPCVGSGILSISGRNRAKFLRTFLTISARRKSSIVQTSLVLLVNR